MKKEDKNTNIIWYQKLAKYYDYFDTVDVPYEETAQLLDKIFEEYHVKSVLDFACGTGGFTIPLREKGYKVTGVDISPSMLILAKKRMAQKRLNDIPLIEGDMRSSKIGNFDALTCMFNSVGDLTKDDLLLALYNMRANLKDGGLLYFDVLNYSFSKAQKQGQDFFVDATFEEGEVSGTRLSKNTLNKKNKTMKVEQIVTISALGKKPRKISANCIMQMHDKEDLDKMLKVTRFGLIRNFGNFSADRGLEPFSKNSPFIGVLAKAK